MNKIILIALGALMVAACSEKPMEQLGDIAYRRGGKRALRLTKITGSLTSKHKTVKILYT